MLTQEQWFQKLKSFVPKWVFQENKNAVAQFYGYAKLLESFQTMVSDHLKETFITTSTGEFLDLHGKDRNKYKSLIDTEESFRSRVREILNSSNVEAIRALVNTLLLRGECTIIEHFAAENFCDRGAFCDRNVIEVGDLIYNIFSILVYHQIPTAITFCDVNAYCDNMSTIGENESDITLFENIVEVVNAAKALGTEYRLIERVSEG